MQISAKCLATIPLIHLGICYLYLLIFFAAFGDNAYIFVEIDNIFTIGISRIMPLYVTLFISGLVGYLFLIKDPLHVVERSEISFNNAVQSKLALNLVYAFIAFLVIYVIISIFIIKAILLNVIADLIAVPIGIFFGLVWRKNSLSRGSVFPVIFFAMAITMIACQAYTDGFKARTKPYRDLLSDFPHCSDGKIILAALGQNFAAVKPDGKRLVIDSDCKALFYFKNESVLIDLL